MQLYLSSEGVKVRTKYTADIKLLKTVAEICLSLKEKEENKNQR